LQVSKCFDKKLFIRWYLFQALRPQLLNRHYSRFSSHYDNECISLMGKTNVEIKLVNPTFGKMFKPHRKYMAESELSKKVKKTITSLNSATLNIATLFQKIVMNGCSAMGEQSNDNMIAVLVYNVRSHFISPYILTRNEAG